MREIFSEAGLDVGQLGSKRLHNFRNCLMQKAAETAGFTDKRKDKSQQAPPSTEVQMIARMEDNLFIDKAAKSRKNV